MRMNFKSLCVGLACCASLAAHSAAFLEPDQAFVLSAPRLDGHGELTVDWVIAPGYKLYRNSIAVVSDDGARTLGPLQLPAAESVFDEGRQQQVEVYHQQLHATTTWPSGQASLPITVRYQGCAEDGLCYPPQSRHFRVQAGDPAMASSAASTPTQRSDAAARAPTAPQATAPRTPPATGRSGDAGVPPVANGNTTVASAPPPLAGADDPSSVQRVLQSGSWWRIGVAFWIFGLLLSLTPCVLPMVPILSSIIVGQGRVSRARGFALAITYSLGMALVYTASGVAAGWVGEGLTAFMQQPAVLIGFSALLVLMALSMFDVYQLQLPSRWQGGVQSASNRFQGGRLLSVFAMGALSALIVGPCVAAPLAGALLYISQSRDVWLGGFALFTMAMGMSVPLLLMGLSAGSLLPRAGAWMNQVKTVFGFMLLGVALWMLNPLLVGIARLLAWGSLLVLAAMFTPLFSATAGGFGHRLAKALGVLLLLSGAGLWIGAMQGHTRLLSPLQADPPSLQAAATPAPTALFEPMRSGAALDAVLAQPGAPLILDFYADWCTSCLEWDHNTLADPRVIQALQAWRRVRVDVTNNTEADRALLKRFHLFGPPGMVFFDAHGQELPGTQLVGYQDPQAFLATLAARQPLASP